MFIFSKLHTTESNRLAGTEIYSNELFLLVLRFLLVFKLLTLAEQRFIDVRWNYLDINLKCPPYWTAMAPLIITKISRTLY